MRRVTLRAAIAVALLLATPGLAHGLDLNSEPGGAITLRSLGRLTFSAGPVTVGCPLTLSGGIYIGPIDMDEEAEEEAEMGFIDSAAFGTCDGGALLQALFTLTDAQWTMWFHAAEGTLPNEMLAIIVRIENVEVYYRGIGTCLYIGDIEGFVGTVGANPYTLQLWTIVNPVVQFVRWAGTFICPETASVRGSFELSPDTRVNVV